MAFSQLQVINNISSRSTMPIITMTTDWGFQDHYLAAFKGEILSLAPSINLIDTSHEIEKFNIMQAAFIIKNSYQKFPVGTLHFISVSGKDNSDSKKPYIIVRSNGHYLLGEDNGIFTLILGDNEKEIIKLPIELESGRGNIHKSLIIMIKKLIDGTNFKELGTVETTLKESYFAQPTVDNRSIRGTIIYIDGHGNGVVNISRELFNKTQNDRKFIINLRKSSYDVTTISQCYEDVEVGEMVALFNQDDYLEIALNKESACKLLGLKIMDSIRIEFDDY